MMPTVYQYRLRGPSGRWVADVVMREDGYFSTVSDWGSYAFWWGAAGKCFRSFVAQLEGQDEYVCSKLARRSEWYDAAGTLRAIKTHILTERREGSMTKEKAAKEWKTLAESLGCWSPREIRDVSEMDLSQFHRWYESTEIGDAHEFCRYNYRPDVRGFCREVMPLLAKMLREELAQEKRTPAPEVSPG